MRLTALLVTVVFACVAASPRTGGHAAAPISETQATAQLRGSVQRALALGPINFAGAYGTVTSTSADEKRYLATGGLARDCNRCEVRDEYAIGTDLRERWVYEFDFTGDTNWNRSRMIEFAEAAIGPLVRSFDLKTGSTDTDETYLDWRSKNMFVYVETFSGKSGVGVNVRVGHYLNKSAHVAKYSGSLTDAEKTRLANGVKNMLSIGLANAPSDFATLRGKSYSKDGYAATVTFDDMIGGCSVSTVAASAGANGAGHWDFTCDTAGFGGDQKALLEFVRSTIWNALPSSFKQSAEADKGAADYRWEDGAAQVTVSLESMTYDDYRTEYEIEVRHWLPST